MLILSGSNPEIALKHSCIKSSILLFTSLERHVNVIAWPRDLNGYPRDRVIQHAWKRLSQVSVLKTEVCCQTTESNSFSGYCQVRCVYRTRLAQVLVNIYTEICFPRTWWDSFVMQKISCLYCRPFQYFSVLNFSYRDWTDVLSIRLNTFHKSVRLAFSICSLFKSWSVCLRKMCACAVWNDIGSDLECKCVIMLYILCTRMSSFLL